MNDNVIMAADLTRRFGDQVAVDDLTFEVKRGEVFGFLGHNGAGKTTTVRLLNGVLEPDAGHAEVLGFSTVEQGPTLRARTGVLTETPSLDERLSGRENLRIYAKLYNVPERAIRERVDQMLATFDLADRGEDKVGGYSKGMKQRLALARALLHQPDLIFLDEPTGGLDPISTRQVHDMIQHQSGDGGRTVFLCTHNLEEAQRLCDRVAVMEHGRLMAMGTPAELARQVGAGLRYAVEVADGDVTRAADLLADVPGLTRLQTNAHHVELSVESREIIPAVLAALVGGEVRVYTVTAQEASLEDIYFRLHDVTNTGDRVQPVQTIAAVQEVK